MPRQLLSLVLSFLSAVAALAADSLFVTPERRVASNGALIPAPYRQDSVTTAAGPDGAFLALWRDDRQDGRSALVATRISATGEILDPEGMVIDQNVFFPVSAAWNGRDYVIVARKTSAVYSYLLAPDGTQRRPPLDIGISAFGNAFVAGNGREAVMAEPSRSLSFLDANGAIEKTLALTSLPGTIEAVVPQGNDWIVIATSVGFTTQPRGQWVRVNRSGIVASRTFNLYPPQFNRSRLNAANNGSTTFLVWESTTTLGSFETEFSTNALLLSSDGFVVFDWRVGADRSNSSNGSTSLRQPSVAWDGLSFVVGWRNIAFRGVNEPKILRVSRITPGQIAVPPPQVIDETPADVFNVLPPSVAASPDALVVAWVQDRPSRPEADIAVRVVPNVDSLEAAAPEILSHAPANEQYVRATVGSDGGIFSVWRERGNIGRIVGELTRADGTKTGRLTISTSAEPSGYPAVAWANGIYLVVWREDESIAGNREFFGVLARRYNDRGEALDDTPIVLTRHSITPPSTPLARRIAIGSHGTSFLVAWIGGLVGQDVYATRVPIDGAVSFSPLIQIRTSVDFDQACAPGIFVEQNQYVVWWSEVDQGFARATAAVVSDSGAVVENPHAIYVRTRPDSQRPGGAIPFDVVSNGAELLSTWRRSTAGLSGTTCIYTMRTDLIGQPSFVEGEPIACGAPSGFDDLVTPAEPRGFWDGTRWWVVYSLASRLYAVPLDAAGKPAGEPLAIATEGTPIDPFVVATPRGFTVLYNYIDPASHFVRRAFQRALVRPRTRVAGH